MFISCEADRGTHLLNEAQRQLSLRNVAAAINLFDRAEASGARPEECASGRWYSWMLLANFENAWRESDHIEACGVPDSQRLWDGAPIEGKRVILRCLHGYGDAIQFIRYAPLLRQRASGLTVEAPPPLVPLFQHLTGPDEVITWGEDAPEHPPEWDSQLEIMELPRFFRTTARDIPRQVPYLRLPFGCVERARQAMGDTALWKVGINWQSSEWDNSRSIPFAQIIPMLRSQGVFFYSLQWGPEREQLRGLDPMFHIQDTIVHSPGILESAAVIANLDLVITVDSMVAHLAGALGRPVLTLLPFQADWRWGLDQAVSPWYPSMRLYRQPRPGSWAPVLEQATRHLAALCHSWRPQTPETNQASD